MTLAESMQDYVASPKAMQYGRNEAHRVEGAFNLPRPLVNVPPNFTTRLASFYPDDHQGERMARGIAASCDFARPLAVALGCDPDVLADAAAHGWVRGFALGIRSFFVRGREVPPRFPALWKGALDAAVSTFRTTGDYSAVGEAVAQVAGTGKLPDDVLGIVGAALAVLDVAKVTPTLVAPRGVSARLDAGSAHVRYELHTVATKLGADEGAASSLAERGVDHYSAAFTAMQLMARWPKSTVLDENRGDGIRRAIAYTLEWLAGVPDGATTLDRALIAADSVEGCLRASGSFESVCGQGMAVLAALPLLLNLPTKRNDT